MAKELIAMGLCISIVCKTYAVAEELVAKGPDAKASCATFVTRATKSHPVASKKIHGIHVESKEFPKRLKEYAENG